MTHDEFHNLKAAYLAGGLADAERAAVEQHAAACPACAAALEQAEAADRELDTLFAAARPGDGLEDRVIAHLRAAPEPPLTLHPLVRKAAVGVAAAILLGGVGFAVTTTSRMDRSRAGQPVSNVERSIEGVQQVALSSPRVLARELGEEIRAGSPAVAAGEVPSVNLEQDVGAKSQEWDTLTRAEGLVRQGQQGQQGQRQEGPQRGRSSDYGISPSGGAAGTFGGMQAGGAGVSSAGVPGQQGVPKGQVKEAQVGFGATEYRFRESGDGAEGRGAAVAGKPDSAGKSHSGGKSDSAGKPVAGVELESVGKDVTEGRGFRPGDVAPFGTSAAGGRLGDGFASNAAPKGDADADGTTERPKLPKLSEPRQTETILGRQVIELKERTAEDLQEGVTLEAEARLDKSFFARADADPNVTAAGQSDAAAHAGEAVQAAVAAATAVQQQPPQVPASQQAERKVIRNGEMTFEVDGYDSAVLQITKIAAEEGGFVATTESEKLPNGKVKGSVVVRCPPDRLDTLVLKLRGLGDLRNSRISAQDITKQYTDLDAQLRAAKTMEGRLLEIIKGGKGEVKDLIEAEKQLGSWREKIEKLEGEIRYYNNLVSLSTLTVTLAERDVRSAALLSETEQVNMGVEVSDVEKARAEAIKAIEEAKGRIVESDLKTHDAGQFAATIAADVAPDRAGPVIDRLKQLGRVARLEVQRRQATAEGTGAPAPGARVERKDTRLLLSIYNLANVAARSKTDLHLAADDVEKAYRAILAQVESAGGRVVNSQLTKPTPQQTTGTISFEVPTAGADVLLDAVRGAGEVVRLETSTNPDTQNVTDAKRAFSVQVRSVATIPARESVTLQLAVDDVASKYDRLLDALRDAGARVVQSEIDQQDANRTTATLQVDARRDQRGAVDKALADAGGVYGRTVSRPAEGEAALEDKVRLNVTMHDVDHLDPRETTTLGVEAQDVTKAAGDVESTAVLLGGRKVDSDWAQQPGGQSIARVVVDVPVARAAELIDKARGQGRVLTVQRDQNPGSPEGAFARARLSVTFATADPIVQRDQSLASSVRSGLATSVQWLLRSVTLVVIGLCLVGPWALVLWLVWKAAKRRRRGPRVDVTPPPAAPGTPASMPAS